jgi:outer membrane protein assembly factor BamB
MAKGLHNIVLPDATQRQEQGIGQSQLAETGLLQSGITAVDQLTSGAADVTLRGRFTGERVPRPAMIVAELRELNAGTKGPLPLFRYGATYPDSGWYELDSVDIERVHPDLPNVFEYTLSLTEAGSRGAAYRAVETNPETVSHPFGSGTDEIVAVPATASKVQWMDVKTREREPATATATVTGQQGDIDQYKLDDSSFDDVRLIYDIAYADDVPGVFVYDTRGNSEKFDGRGRRQWQSVNEAQHDIDDTVVLRNSRLRIRCEEGAATAAGRWNDSAGSQDWSFATGDAVRSGVAVADGRVFVGSFDNNVYALDAATGTKEWEFATGGFVTSGITTDNGSVFVGSNDNNVYALDAATGTKEWEFATGASVTSGIAVADGTVFAGSTDNNVYALDTATGTKEWEFATGGDATSGIAVADDTVFAGSTDNNVYALDAATGTKEWEFATGGFVTSGITTDNGSVFVGSNDNNVYALDAATGTKEWEFATGASVTSGIAVAGGTVFVGSDDNNVYALDAATGTKEWEFGTGGVVTSGIAVADGTVFAGSTDSNVYALDAATGTKEWEFGTGSFIDGGLAVADGRVFAGSNDDNVYAIEREWRPVGIASDSPQTIVDVDLVDVGQHRIEAQLLYDISGQYAVDVVLQVGDKNALIAAADGESNTIPTDLQAHLDAIAKADERDTHADRDTVSRGAARR